MKKEDDSWAEELKKKPESKIKHDPKPFHDFMEKSLKINTNQVLTLEQCQGINKDLFKSDSKIGYTLREFLDRIEDNFEKGIISEEIRNDGIAAFNSLTKSMYVRREKRGGEYKYIFEE